MAYDVIPETKKELRSSLSDFSEEVLSDANRLFCHLEKKYSKIKAPLAFDPKKKNECKITRALQTEFKLGDLKKELKLSKLRIDFGDGSRGNRGLGNQGTLFEIELQEGFDNWIEDNNTKHKYSVFIKEMIKHYKLEECKAVKCIAEGGENKKRPISLEGKKWRVGDASDALGYDIGATVTDLTLEVLCADNKLRKYYISCKTSGTTNLSNLGLKGSVFPVQQIKDCNITTDSGEALIETFGLDKQKLCDTFNKFDAGDRTYKESATATGNKAKLAQLIKGSLGYGYHYVHLDRGKIKHFEIDEKFLNSAAKASSIRIEYGGETGGAKRINMHVKTPKMDLMFNIRNTTTKGTKDDPNRVYPDKLQSAYKMTGESQYTEVLD